MTGKLPRIQYGHPRLLFHLYTQLVSEVMAIYGSATQATRESCIMALLVWCLSAHPSIPIYLYRSIFWYSLSQTSRYHYPGSQRFFS